MEISAHHLEKQKEVLSRAHCGTEAEVDSRSVATLPKIGVVAADAVVAPTHRRSAMAYCALVQIAPVVVVPPVVLARYDGRGGPGISRGVLVVLVVAHIDGPSEHSARTQTAVFRGVAAVAQPVGPYKLLGELFAVDYVDLPVPARLKKLRRLHSQLELAQHDDYSILQEVDPNLDLACVQECSGMVH